MLKKHAKSLKKMPRINRWAIASTAVGIVAVALVVFPGQAGLLSPALAACATAMVLGVWGISQGSRGRGKEKVRYTWLAFVGIALPVLAFLVLLLLLVTAAGMP
jgi:drug/metabolite transporter (DMT)-like permease